MCHGPRQAHHSLPRHRRRSRRQGRQLREPARRRRSGRGRAPLRRAGRRRARVPRHPREHRDARPALRHDRGGRRSGVHSADRRRRRQHAVDDIRALLNAGADKVSINTAGGAQPGSLRRGVGALRLAVHRRGDRREAIGARSVAGLHARRSHADRHRCGRLGARGRRRAAPARSCSPAWTATARARASTSH